MLVAFATLITLDLDAVLLAFFGKWLSVAGTASREALEVGTFFVRGAVGVVVDGTVDIGALNGQASGGGRQTGSNRGSHGGRLGHCVSSCSIGDGNGGRSFGIDNGGSQSGDGRGIVGDGLSARDPMVGVEGAGEERMGVVSSVRGSVGEGVGGSRERRALVRNGPRGVLHLLQGSRGIHGQPNNVLTKSNRYQAKKKGSLDRILGVSYFRRGHLPNRRLAGCSRW